MTGTMYIGTERRAISDWNEPDIARLINRHHDGGTPICVRITIEEGCARMTLGTPTCHGGGGGGRAPNECEAKIFALWTKLGLDRADYTAGNLIGFLKQAEHLLG